MRKSNTTIHFIPSGMKIGSSLATLRESEKESKNMNIKNKNFRNRNKKFVSTQEMVEPQDYEDWNSPKQECSKNLNSNTEHEVKGAKVMQAPPKTICKNRSINLDYTCVPINENTVWEQKPDEISDPQAVRSKLWDKSEETNVPRAVKSKLWDKPEETSVPRAVKSKLCDKSDETSVPQAVSLKSKMYALIEQHKLKKKITEESEATPASPTFAIKTQTCQCNKCDKFVTCEYWLENNIAFNESHDIARKNGLPLLTNETEREVIIFKTFDKVLLHGTILPKPIFSLDKTKIDDNIQKALTTMNCTSANDIQSYMWSAIRRGFNVFMIAGPKSGKTLAYLPTLCSFAMEKNEADSEFSKYEGPSVVILCSNTEKCNEIQELISTLTAACWEAPVVEVLTDSSAIKRNCDMLVTMPSTLEECVKLGKVGLKRVCHVAIEDGHVLLKKYKQSMQKILQIIDIINAKRPQHVNVQVILSSEKWSDDLETLSKELYITPLLCFEDFLQAANYSKVKIWKKKLKPQYKQFYLNDILKSNYTRKKTVVFCDEDEISAIKEFLEIEGIECIMISNDLIEDQIFENEDMWRFLAEGEYKVLLCTDALFEKTVQVLNASWVIHYSPPTNGTQFQKRFRCFAQNLGSPFDISNSIYNTQDNCCYLLIDENNDHMFSYLC